MLQQKCNNMWLFFVPVTLLVSGQAISQTVYNTKRVLQEQGNACANSNATVCQSVPLGRTIVASEKSTTFDANCPSDYPILVGWDATHSEQIVAGIRPGSLTDNGMQIVVGNRADRGGFIKVLLGCATDRLAQKGNLTITESLDAVPTNTSAVGQQ